VPVLEREGAVSAAEVAVMGRRSFLCLIVAFVLVRPDWMRRLSTETAGVLLAFDRYGDLDFYSPVLSCFTGRQVDLLSASAIILTWAFPGLG
jgi:hypothetical protein